MSSWIGSASFVLFSALFGCVFGFGIAAFIRGMKTKKCGEAMQKDKQNHKK